MPNRNVSAGAAAPGHFSLFSRCRRRAEWASLANGGQKIADASATLYWQRQRMQSVSAPILASFSPFLQRSKPPAPPAWVHVARWISVSLLRDGMQAAIRAQICALRIHSVRIHVLPFRCALLLPADLPSPPSASKNAQAVNTTDTRRHTAGQSKGRSEQGNRQMY